VGADRRREERHSWHPGKGYWWKIWRAGEEDLPGGDAPELVLCAGKGRRLSHLRQRACFVAVTGNMVCTSGGGRGGEPEVVGILCGGHRQHGLLLLAVEPGGQKGVQPLKILHQLWRHFSFLERQSKVVDRSCGVRGAVLVIFAGNAPSK